MSRTSERNGPVKIRVNAVQMRSLRNMYRHYAQVHHANLQVFRSMAWHAWHGLLIAGKIGILNR
jgi:hypothetical protein